MADAEKKYPIRSEKYKGVFQRKSGKWFFRYKRIMTHGGKFEYYQESGFATEEQAYNAMQTHLYHRYNDANIPGQNGDLQEITFGDLFKKFLETCDSDATVKKYNALYTAQLSKWKNRDIGTISNNDIDLLLLKMALDKHKPSYQKSVRNMLKRFFKYANQVCVRVSGEVGQTIDTQPYKLRVLSLFSGIGAPEQAIKNIGLEYELVNFVESDDRTADAYCLLHKVDKSKRIKDITTLDMDYCFNHLSGVDLMTIGVPEGEFNSDGEQPKFEDVIYNNLETDNAFYRALQVVFWKKPKFVVAVNMPTLANKDNRLEFHAIIRIIQDMGYNVYFETLNSTDYRIPHYQKRLYMVMIRDDLNIAYNFPRRFTELPIAENWISEWLDADVAENHYINSEKQNSLATRLETYDFNHLEGYIKNIPSKWTTPFGSGQTYVKDNKGIRCLTNSEQMRFQGFPTEYSSILSNHGFSYIEIAEFVGSSPSVYVLSAFLLELLSRLKRELAVVAVPRQVIQAQEDRKYIEPLFPYSGNKKQLLPFLTYLLPADIEKMTFVDLFGGSGMVSVNSNAKRVILNELNPFLVGIYRALSVTPSEEAWAKVMEIWEKYNLCVKCDKDKYSCCPEYAGLSKEVIEKEYNPCERCRQKYLNCRSEYNKIPYAERTEKFWYWSLALVYNSFNSSWVEHDDDDNFTSPFGAGKVSLNKSKKHFFEFVTKLQERQCEIHCNSFNEVVVEKKEADEEFFYYLDPPYLASNTMYSDGWNITHEHALYEFLDDCTEKGIKWMLSNVILNNGDENKILIEWLKKRQYTYNIYYMKRDYSNSIYNRKDKGPTIEVAVTNYHSR